MFLAVLSTLISSIALVGVVISLLLQARQLRVNQVQAARASQIELIKFALSNPEISMEVEGAEDSETFIRNVVRNWYFTHLSLGYEVGNVPRSRLQSIASLLFADESTRRWWAETRQGYNEGASSRRDKEFFTIIDGEYQKSNQRSESAKTGDTPPDTPVGSSP
jgi:hypothetical protein